MKKVILVGLLALLFIGISYGQVPQEHSWIIGTWEQIDACGRKSLWIFNDDGTGKADTTNTLFSITESMLSVTFILPEHNYIERIDMIMHKINDHKIILYDTGKPFYLNKVKN